MSIDDASVFNKIGLLGNGGRAESSTERRQLLIELAPGHDKRVVDVSLVQ